MRSNTSVFGEMAEKLDEFDAYGTEERDELLEMVEMAEESAMDELEQLGFIAIMDDFEECRDFALVDEGIHYLEAQFASGSVGMAECFEYDELMAEFDELMSRG